MATRTIFATALVDITYRLWIVLLDIINRHMCKASKKDKKKVQEVPQSQTAVLPRHQEEEEMRSHIHFGELSNIFWIAWSVHKKYLQLQH